MSTALMIFIGENIKFDYSSTVQTISSMNNIYDLEIREENLLEKDSIGSVLVGEYRYDNDIAFFRLDNSLEFISVKRLGKASLDFALKLQSLMEIALTATDKDYSFLVKLKNIASVQEFEQLMCSGVYME